ncbi:MAG: hypothetical protein ABIN01_10235, partial [Ferruginibacter sp.]
MKKIRRCLLLLQLLALFANVWAQNTPAPNKLIEFVLTPNAKDWNYKVNEQTSIQVSVLKFGVPMDDVSVSYETGPEMLPADKKGTAVFKNGQGKIEIGTSKQPGFRQLLVKTEYKGRTYSDMIKVA